MKKVSNIFFWWRHLFWLVGKAYLYALVGDEKNAVECLMWLEVHLSYDCALVAVGKTSLKQKLRYHATTLFGLLLTALFFYMIITLII